MKKFDFRLQRVIEVREAKKEECQRELATSQRELERQEQLLQEAAADCQSSHDRLRQVLKKSCNAGLLVSLEKWRRRREEDLEHQSQRTVQQRQAVEHKRANLIVAAKDQEVLEHLKEKAQDAHRTECQREEQAFLDELGCRVGKTWRYPRSMSPLSEDRYTE